MASVLSNVLAYAVIFGSLRPSFRCFPQPLRQFRQHPVRDPLLLIIEGVESGSDEHLPVLPPGEAVERGQVSGRICPAVDQRIGLAIDLLPADFVVAVGRAASRTSGSIRVAF
ncbi:MAG TPA: hypothetical protein VJ302_08510 [Blastocatellia bacterium]|nr:hypothetical protein [Blastocatellia bacterium]